MQILRLCLCVLWLAVAAAAQKVSYDEFTDLLAQSTRLNDQKRFDRTIKENPTHTLMHFRGLLMDELAGRASDDNHEQRQALREGWKRAFDGDTLSRVSRWLQSVGETALRNDENTRQALNKAYAELTKLTENRVKERQPWEALRNSVRQIAQSFESIGNRLGAAETWALAATINDQIPEQSVDDQRDAVFAIERFQEHRDTWEFKTDDHYLRNVNWMKSETEKLKVATAAAAKRKEEGYGENVRGVDAFLLPGADKLEKKFPLEFKALAKPTKADMSPQGGPVPMLWPRVDFQGEQGLVELIWFKGATLFAARPGMTKFAVTLDGSQKDLDKNDLTPVSAGSKIRKPSLFYLDAERNRPYAMWFYFGGSQERFMGLNQNLAPAKERATLYYKSASSWVADIDGTKVVFFDDNNNGKLFEEDPMEYGLTDRHVGQSPEDEVRVPAYDAMRIGKSATQPFSSWIKIEDSWYHLRGQDDGKAVGLRPTNPEYFKSGTLQFEWSGPRGAKPEVLIVEGVGDFATARFDVSDGEPVEVPASKYRVRYGRMVQGKGARVLTANIWGGAAEPVEVKAGETSVVELGAPFKIDFVREGRGSIAKINALKLRVVGKAGELYTHINGAAPAPEVVTAKSEDGKGAKVVGEFINMTDAEAFNRLANANGQTIGSQVGFYPVVKGDARGSLSLEVKVPPGHLVGLRQNKNKLFGKLLPIFK